jgi:hypothetical protein
LFRRRFGVLGEELGCVLAPPLGVSLHGRPAPLTPPPPPFLWLAAPGLSLHTQTLARHTGKQLFTRPLDLGSQRLQRRLRLRLALAAHRPNGPYPYFRSPPSPHMGVGLGSSNPAVLTKRVRFHHHHARPIPPCARSTSASTTRDSAMKSHGAAATTTDAVMTMLEDQSKIGMSFLYACLAVLLTAFFLS